MIGQAFKIRDSLRQDVLWLWLPPHRTDQETVLMNPASDRGPDSTPPQSGRQEAEGKGRRGLERRSCPSRSAGWAVLAQSGGPPPTSLAGALQPRCLLVLPLQAGVVPQLILSVTVRWVWVSVTDRGLCLHEGPALTSQGLLQRYRIKCREGAAQAR